MEVLRASNTALKASIRTLILTVARTQDVSPNPIFLTRPGMIVFSFGVDALPKSHAAYISSLNEGKQ
jgi:hypothetical protein